jgi:integrase
VLTELQCRSAKPRTTPYKLADSRGLYLFVTPTGYRSFRWKYRFERKEKTLVLGPWPELSLKEARDRRDEAARTLRAGEDPSKRARLQAAAKAAGPTFKDYALRWHADQAPLWKPQHAKQVLDSFVSDVFPAIGAKAMADVRPGQVRDLLLKVQERGSIDIAHRIRGRISAVFGRAMAEELVESDPAAAVAAVLKPVKTRRMPAIVDLERARAFLRAVEAEPAHPVTKLASRLLALTAVRPGVIRATPKTGEFLELEGEEPLWHVPAERMKLELDQSEQEAFDFLVPLSRQAAETIRVAQQLAGRAPWLFPGIRDAQRPISENALSSMYKRLPEGRRKHVPHGWRSTFSSVMNELAAQEERLGDEDVIELMLAHKPKGVRGVYNRAAYLRRRREIAQEWADLLLKGFAAPEALLDGPRH